MQGDGVVLSVLNPYTVSVLIFVLFVIDKDEYLFHARVLSRSKAQADGIELSSPNLKHTHTHTQINRYMFVHMHTPTVQECQNKDSGQIFYLCLTGSEWKLFFYFQM